MLQGVGRQASWTTHFSVARRRLHEHTRGSKIDIHNYRAILFIRLLHTIQPELALEVYEAALKKNPRDAILASKIGQALVKTHNYNRAISYYDAALKSSENQHLMRYSCKLYRSTQWFLNQWPN